MPVQNPNGARPLGETHPLREKVAQTSDGYYLVALRGYEWQELIPTTARCLFCPATFDGTAAEAKAWSAQHRETHFHGSTPSLKERKAAAARAKQQHTGAGYQE